MQPLHERFLTAIAAEHTRLSSRRGFLAGSAKLAGGAGLALLATGAGSVAAQEATPVASPAAPDFTSDLDVLNYALTLEHLEYAFYRDGLAKFDAAAFQGKRPAEVRPSFVMIAGHEQSHVATLTQVITKLGGTPVAEATYDFGYGDDLNKFIAVAQALENTGVSAYLGAAKYLQNKDLLTAAATIVTVEARHAAYLNERNNMTPFPAAFDTPKTKAQILQIAGPFIKQP